jgi:hypothetical protein
MRRRGGGWKAGKVVMQAEGKLKAQSSKLKKVPKLRFQEVPRTRTLPIL